MAVDVPDLIMKSTPYKVSGYDIGAVGYLNYTLSNLIFYYILIFSEYYFWDSSNFD